VIPGLQKLLLLNTPKNNEPTKRLLVLLNGPGALPTAINSLPSAAHHPQHTDTYCIVYIQTYALRCTLYSLQIPAGRLADRPISRLLWHPLPSGLWAPMSGGLRSRRQR